MLEVLLPESWGTAMEERHKEMYMKNSNYNKSHIILATWGNTNGCYNFSWARGE